MTWTQWILLWTSSVTLLLWIQMVHVYVSCSVILESNPLIIIANQLKLILFFLELLLKVNLWRISSDLMFLMLKTSNQCILPSIVVLISLHFRFIHSFFHTAHISIHFELILHSYLLIEHISIPLLLLLFVLQGKLFELSILFCLLSRLIVIEVVVIIKSLEFA